MNLPIIPGQKSSGKKGANVVKVPANTGMKTSPAAILAEKAVVSLFLPSINIRCVFSITTIASSTIIPKPNNKANRTMKLRVTLEPVMRFAAGKKRNATNMLSGTDSATKKALVTPIKNMSINNTNINPMTIEFTKSLKEVLVALLASPVMTMFKFLGKEVACISVTIFFTPSDVSIKFSPALLITCSVTTFFPFNLA